MSTVKVYGADWCGQTRRMLTWLDERGVAYEYINVDENPEASEWVKQQNGGKEKKPTLDIAGSVLTTPKADELEDVLRREHVLS